MFKSRTTAQFRRLYSKLPRVAQLAADSSYRLWKQDPAHPSLRFKIAQSGDNVYSVRITRHYRALGVREDQTIVWFWIGDHNEYERILRGL